MSVSRQLDVSHYMSIAHDKLSASNIWNDTNLTEDINEENRNIISVEFGIDIRPGVGDDGRWNTRVK
jgi:hypothetical protein